MDECECPAPGLDDGLARAALALRDYADAAATRRLCLTAFDVDLAVIERERLTFNICKLVRECTHVNGWHHGTYRCGIERAERESVALEHRQDV